MAYITHLAIPISAGDPWLMAHNMQEEERVALRLSRVEMLAWALAGATVAGEAWMRLGGQGQGEQAGFAGAPLSLLLLHQVNQLVRTVQEAVFECPEGG